MRESGQAAIETALVMPLFVFLILGLLQMGLLHQARVMTKYAAYKAVRVGAIHSAKMEAMEKAALAVLLPMTGSRAGNQGAGFYKATPGSYAMSWAMAKGTLGQGETKAPLRVIICDPTTRVSADFDDPDGAMGPNGGWEGQNHGRLAIQITNYYNMVIPFANAVIFYILVAEERAEFYKVLRMRPEGDTGHKGWLADRKKAANGESRTVEKFVTLAGSGTYVIPIRAGWSMRMQSNYLPNQADFEIPSENFCRVGWSVIGKGANKGVD